MYTGIVIALFVYPVAYAVFQAASLIRWQGLSRMAAMVPLAFIVAMSIVVSMDLREDPASHNLWPLEVVLWSATSLAVLCLISIARGVGQLAVGIRDSFRRRHAPAQASPRPG